MDERHMYRGKRLDSGEWVEGSLVDKNKWFGCYEIVVCNDGVGAEESYTAYEVDPATVEPVKAKTKRTAWSLGTWYGYKHHCPNCDMELRNESNYCPTCGQALDWTHDTPELMEGAE